MKYIAIDLGSSFIKFALFDLWERRILECNKTAAPSKRMNKNPLLYEIPANQFFQILQEQIDFYTRKYKDVHGLIISTQMHGFIYALPEREDIYVSWQDMRCLDKVPGKEETFLEEMKKLVSLQDMQVCGVYLKPSLGICNLTAMLKQEELPRNGILFTLGSYLIDRLTGNNICHISNAAPLGLADVKHHCWNKELQKKLGLENIRLPELAKSDFELCGTYISNGQKINIYPDYGDMQISILGSRTRKNDAVINIATGAQVAYYRKDFQPGPYEIRPYFDGTYLNVISNMPAGRNLNVLVDFLKDAVESLSGSSINTGDIWNYLKNIDMNNNGLVVETGFYKNPYYENGGAIRFITQNNLKIDTIFAAAFRNMAETYWKYIKELCKSEDEIQRIVCAGGVSWRTPLLCGMIEQVCGKEQVLSASPDESLAGMYCVSLVCGKTVENLTEGLKYISDVG